jgi:hypothetical protein
VHFFEGIPGFCRSSIINYQDALRNITSLGKDKLHGTVKGLLERTWSSNSLSNSEKLRRVVACVNFADTARLRDVASLILKDIFPRDLHNALQSIEMGRLLRNQGNGDRQRIGLCAQSIVAGIISNVESSNEHWVALAADQLGESEHAIRRYLERGNDNVLLANLNHITRKIFYSLKDNPDMAASSALIIPSLANLDVRNTLPELQSSFLSLWDEIEKAPNDSAGEEIRDNLRDLYTAVRRAQGTNDGLNETSPFDNHGVPGDSSHSAPLIQARTHTTIPLPVSDLDSSLATSSSYSSFPAPDLITIDPPDELSPGGGIPEGTRCAATATASSDPTSTGTSQAVGSAATAIPDNIADTQSGGQPTVRSSSSSVLPAMVTSTPSSTIPEVDFRPHIADTAPFVAYHDGQGPNDPIETSAEHRDASDNPTDTESPHG